MKSMNKRIVNVAGLAFGDGNVYIQSMLNRRPDDIAGNIAQARELAAAGCEVIRVAVPERHDVRLIAELKSAISEKVPIVADIHFDYRIAIEAVNAGADKIRINPGNIGDDSRVKAVVTACRSAGIPIRVGVNAGSVAAGKTIVQSAVAHVRLLEKFDFDDIVVSVKSSSVVQTISAYRELAGLLPYPLHLGVTEAGTVRTGLIKSAIGIGGLLCDNIGDTIRVSLTAEPVEEVAAAVDILRAVGKRSGVDIISCPTCGRCKIDVVKLAGQVEQLVRGVCSAENAEKSLTIAVMGCAVNGPGECKHADIGITGGDGEGLIFAKGEIVQKVAEHELLPALESMLKEY